ncbi:MAG: glycosyltransferase family 2 protein [Acidobacteria bacterium]|nr:glycosyltransferase family 2 protein [Acidobacteriota bacterium]
MNAHVAAVVVTYNSAAVIDNCLRSLQDFAEIVVVDNASADETCCVVAQYGARVRLIANPENRGFAGAANQGIQATNSPLVLFLNPDAALATAVEPMVARFAMPHLGAVAGRLVDPDGRTQVGFNLRAFPTPLSLAFEALLLNRLWPGNPVNRRYRCLDLDYAREQDVDQPAGAFLMVRRDVLHQVSGWDERFYPLWFEDVDLCRRIRQAGYAIRYVPEVVARHQGAHSLSRISLEQKQIYWYGSLLAYAVKNFSPWAQVGLRATVWAGALLRTLAAWGRGGESRGYRRVMGLALARQATAARQVQPHVLM